MKKLSEHITIRNQALFCLNCGQSYELNMPVPVDEMTKKMEAFSVLHSDCQKTWKEPENAIGKDLLEKVHYWLAQGERGISSETMVEVMTGIKCTSGSFGHGHPYDPDDFKRCYKLLKMVPELISLLPKMRNESKVWNNLIDNWDELTRMYEENVRTGWKNYKKIGMYEFMQKCIR